MQGQDDVSEAEQEKGSWQAFETWDRSFKSF